MPGVVFFFSSNLSNPVTPSDKFAANKSMLCYHRLRGVCYKTLELMIQMDLSTSFALAQIYAHYIISTSHSLLPYQHDRDYRVSHSMNVISGSGRFHNSYLHKIVYVLSYSFTGLVYLGPSYQYSPSLFPILFRSKQMLLQFFFLLFWVTSRKQAVLLRVLATYTAELTINPTSDGRRCREGGRV